MDRVNAHIVLHAMTKLCQTAQLNCRFGWCRGAKAASLATTAAEQPASATAGMTLRHASTAADMHAAEAAAHVAKAAPRVHRHVVRESDMRKFAGQVSVA